MDDERLAPLELDPEEFRLLGRRVVDDLAELLASLQSGTRPVAGDDHPDDVRALLGDAPLPERGAPPRELLGEARDLLFEHATFNGHPRFFGYVTAPAAPLGVLGELLAAGANPNVGGWQLSPAATEIERQTVRWIAELVGFPADCGGLLVSGGNMANFVGFLAARRARAPWNVREQGTGEGRLCVYTSGEAHTWIQKAADLFGLGTDSIRWIATDADLRIRVDALREQIDADRAAGDLPFLVVGNGGTVGTGAVDPLPELAAVSREHGLWFHVDGAYGAFAAAVPDAPDDLRGLAQADSIALDPHKWLYAPLEAGCALVRDPQALLDTFSYRPPYYHFDAEELNYYELGPQNSRGFRALKIWLMLRQVGRRGYVEMIAQDMALAKLLFELADADAELEARTHNLSITTFRYIPGGVTEPEYLDRLNEELLSKLKRGGEAFMSNAIVDERFWLRACIVNFRTKRSDVEALVALVKRLGAELHAALPAAP